MKSLIINPPGREKRPPAHFPLGLSYIAKALMNNNYQIVTLDLDLARENSVRFVSKEKMKTLLYSKLKESDVVFIGGLSNSYKWVKWINKTIKEIDPSKKIIVGNTVGSTIPETALKHLHCDIVVMFEGEETSVKLLNALKDGKSLSKVKGIWYKDKEGIHENKKHPFIKNLDEIDFPAWEVFPIEEYLKNSATGAGALKAMNVIAVRGCPFSCNYCCKVFGKTARFRTPENIIEEIRLLHNKYDVRYINFADDLFTINKKFIFDFCNKLIASGMNIKWSAAVRLNTIDKEILKKMKKAGCNFIGYGVESGCQKILNNMNKSLTVNQIIDVVKIIKKVGGYNDAPSFMIGYPGETKETIKETVKFAIKHKLPSKFFYTTAYPGTKLYENWKDKIIEKYGSEDKYMEALADPNTIPLMNFTNMSDDELIKMKEWADEKLRKNTFLIAYRIFKYFKSAGFAGFNKMAFIRAKEMIFTKKS